MAARIELAGDLERQLQRLVEPDIDRRARAVLATAKADAPVDSGAYRDSLRQERLPGGGGRVIADVEHAAFVEFGTSRQHAHRTLMTALKAAKE